MVLGFLLLTAVATTPAAPAERLPPAPVERTPIFLHSDARDIVGATYVDRLRRALAGSSAYRPVMHPVSAQFVVGIVTMDPAGADAGSAAGRSTAAAVTLQREQPTGRNQFVYSWVLDGYEMEDQHVVVVGNDDHAAVMGIQVLPFRPASVTVLTNAGRSGRVTSQTSCAECPSVRSR